MGQTPRSMSQGKEIMVPTERSYHREYSFEISKFYHSLFKRIFTALFTRLFLNENGRVVKNGKQSNPVVIFFKQCMCKKVDITIMWWPNNDGAMMQQQWCDRTSLHPHRTLASCHRTSHRTDVPSRHRLRTTVSWLHRPKHDGAIINYVTLSRFHTI